MLEFVEAKPSIHCRFIDMTDQFRSGPPSPEEIQRQMADFMKQHFPNMGFFNRPQTAGESGDESAPVEPKGPEFFFDKKPRDVEPKSGSTTSATSDPLIFTSSISVHSDKSSDARISYVPGVSDERRNVPVAGLGRTYDGVNHRKGSPAGMTSGWSFFNVFA